MFENQFPSHDCHQATRACLCLFLIFKMVHFQTVPHKHPLNPTNSVCVCLQCVSHPAPGWLCLTVYALRPSALVTSRWTEALS